MNKQNIYYIEAYKFKENQFLTGFSFSNYDNLLKAFEETKELGGTTICYFRIKLK